MQPLDYIFLCAYGYAPPPPPKEGLVMRGKNCALYPDRCHPTMFAQKPTMSPRNRYSKRDYCTKPRPPILGLIILRQLFGNDFVSLLKSLWNETAIHRLDYRLDYITWFRTLAELITLQLWTHSPALVEMVKLQTDSI